MKKIVLLATVVFSINAIAINTEQPIKKTMIDSSDIMVNNLNSEPKIADFFKKANLNVPSLLSLDNPACIKACNREFNACLDAGYPWNSCNWEFQDCADICLAIPNC